MPHRIRLSPLAMLRELTDPGDVRTWLEGAGVKFSFNCYGVKQSEGHDGRLAAIANPHVPGGVTPIPNAFVLGWRTRLKF